MTKDKFSIETRELGDIAVIRSGGTPSMARPEFWNGEVPWVTAKDMKTFYISDSSQRISKLGSSNGTKVAPKGTILILSRGMTLRKDVPICFTVEDCCFNQDVRSISSEIVDNEYLAFFLAAQKGQLLKSIVSAGHGTGVLPSESLKSLPVDIPDTGTMAGLVSVFRCVDRLCTRTQDLIAVASRRRQALMQQLLTGKRRFPGFSKPWKKVAIGDLLKEVKRPVAWNDDAIYDLLSIRRRSGGLFLRERLQGRQILTKNLSTTKEGDFLISKMQVLHGATAMTTAEFDGMHISGSYVALRVRDASLLAIRYFNYLAMTKRMYHLSYISSYGVHI